MDSYVAEQMKNRVLRFFQKPEGVFHSSVFCQFSGGVGPNAIAIDSKGNVYVAQYDIAGGWECCVVFCNVLYYSSLHNLECTDRNG